MIIALPLTENDEFSPHFGGSSKVGIFDVDPANRVILSEKALIPPEAEPCAWAGWLGSQGVRYFLAGGIGQGAQQRMSASGIQVIAGVPDAQPRDLVQAWLEGNLSPGANACEGGHHGHGHEGKDDNADHDGHACHCGSH